MTNTNAVPASDSGSVSRRSSSTGSPCVFAVTSVPSSSLSTSVATGRPPQRPVYRSRLPPALPNAARGLCVCGAAVVRRHPAPPTGTPALVRRPGFPAAPGPKSGCPGCCCGCLPMAKRLPAGMGSSPSRMRPRSSVHQSASTAGSASCRLGKRSRKADLPAG